MNASDFERARALLDAAPVPERTVAEQGAVWIAMGWEPPRIDPLDLSDLKSMAAKAREPWVRENVTAEMLDDLTRAGPEWAVHHQGSLIGAGGFVECGGGAAIAWALVKEGLGTSAALAATKAARAGLRAAPYHWIEAQIADGCGDALRWAKLLGFVPINGARLFGADGLEFHRLVFRNT